MQTRPSFRLIEESQRSPRTKNRTLPCLVEAPAWTSFNCRLHHGTCSCPLFWYQCKQVAGLASTKILYCFQPEPESLLLPCYSQGKGLYASLDHIQWPSDLWNQLTPVDPVSSSLWIAFNCRLNCGASSRPLFRYLCKLVTGYTSKKIPHSELKPTPESLSLPWCSQGKGPFTSIRKRRSPASKPLRFDFSRRLKNWSQLTPFDLASSPVWIVPNCRLNRVTSTHPLPYCVQMPAPESLLLPWNSQGKGLLASTLERRSPASIPFRFDFSRRLKNWNQLTLFDLGPSPVWIVLNCSLNRVTSSRPSPCIVKLQAPESLLLPWYPKGKGLFASSCKGRSPISNPACFGFSRRLKNWSPANTNTQLSTLSQGNGNTLSSQHPLTTILRKHPHQHPPPPSSDIKNV